MSGETTAPHGFGVGDWVATQFGLARIIEDRGPLGVGRRHLYRIRTEPSSGEANAFELRGIDLQLVLSREAIISFLKQGGLVKILKSNTGGGKRQPRVWLIPTREGGVSYTFDVARNGIGGATIPFFALHEGRVFEPEADSAVEFLSSFGLDRAAAMDVIRAVGTSP